MNRWAGLGLLLITLGALALRSPQLGLRPMHNDEAVNALKIQGLLETGHYAYDPNEHHGPTLYYATLPFVWFSGARDANALSESTLRAVAVFFCLALILLLWLMADGLGRTAVLAAGVLTALSPAMVFYSRYFIHEMLLVCFTLLVIAAGWRYSRTRHAGWAAVVGAGLGLMYATKETFIIALAAMVGALVLCALTSRKSGDPAWDLTSWWNWKHAAVAAGAAVAVSLLFFTSFFTNASGPLDSLRTYAPWLKRAGGDSPHIHPWWFYLERLVYFHPNRSPVWSEASILLLALAGGFVAFRKTGFAGASAPLARFLAAYTLLLTAAYSLIAYKTPWCLLGFWHGMILLAGIGVAVLVHGVRVWPGRATVAAVLLAAAVHLGWQAWRASVPFASDRRNPYVYAQTVPDVLRLAGTVRDLAKVHADGTGMLIKVMAPDSDYWPLPWYLREFKQVGWWGAIPEEPYAPVMIAGAALKAAFDERSNKDWLMVRYFELRPGTFLELYVQFDLWAQYVQTLPRVADE
jgi:uncharacterized protein (TIGR03663 family)